MNSEIRMLKTCMGANIKDKKWGASALNESGIELECCVD